MGELQVETIGEPTLGEGPWYRDMTRYCWFVLVVAAMGWLFDCLDQHLFNLARSPAMEELLQGTDHNPTAFGYFATGIFLAGWGTGGLFFGALGDKLGRAKTMILCILVYSACTGLSRTVARVLGFCRLSIFYRFGRRRRVRRGRSPRC